MKVCLGVEAAELSGRVHRGHVVWEDCTPEHGPPPSLLDVGQKAAWDLQSASLYIGTHLFSLFLLLPNRL